VNRVRIVTDPVCDLPQAIVDEPGIAVVPLSATMQSAELASRDVDAAPVSVIDGRTVSLAQGMIVVECACHAAGGASHDEVLARAGEPIASAQLWRAVDTLAAAGAVSNVGVHHAACPDVEQFVEMTGSVHDNEIVVGDIGPVVGAHTGRGTIGIAWNA
jgi:fatty acid-binding protein DegV